MIYRGERKTHTQENEMHPPFSRLSHMHEHLLTMGSSEVIAIVIDNSYSSDLNLLLPQEITVVGIKMQ